ncbi:formyl transferase [Leptospira yasudae]|uniref:methionyl-tRNA formyltransferase n=1 Tax=Leptospira yasudae TaxID=2202201 RepID=UPI000E5A05A2|nr:methionyl-tRNA formyltransferase [Leptospira yasudae]RHX91167.1 formyl transferase [Leptospira yasudae]
MKTFVFCGFGKLGFLCLSKLCAEGYIPLAVLTHKDMGAESVDLFAEQKCIPVYYGDLRKDSLLFQYISNLEFTYLISVNYRYIIPQVVLDKAKYPLNLHGSLLPKYRGRTPHVWAIINGEKKTGVTCHVMEQSVDTGAIYRQIELVIDETDTGSDILEKFCFVYPICLMDALTQISRGNPPKLQDHSFATYFGKRTPDMGYIDVNKEVNAVLNFIRAQAKPYPGAYFYLPTGRKIVIHAAKRINRNDADTHDIGMILSQDSNYILNLPDGKIQITDYEIQ